VWTSSAWVVTAPTFVASGGRGRFVGVAISRGVLTAYTNAVVTHQVSMARSIGITVAVFVTDITRSIAVAVSGS